MEFWEWFTLITGIIGVAAFLMASFHIWGKPKIKVVFDCTRGYNLTCWIRNMPIHRILSSLNVIRRQIQISPMITIINGDGETIHFLHYASTSSDDIRLRIAEVKSSQNGKVFLKDQNNQFTYEVLKVGLYKLILELWGDGRKLLKKERRFCINQTKPFVELIC